MTVAQANARVEAKRARVQAQASVGAVAVESYQDFLSHRIENKGSNNISKLQSQFRPINEKDN